MRSKVREVPNRETTRRAILDAARSLFVSEGRQGVSIRRIAERIDISAAAVYLYFPGKADILAALGEEGFRRLARALAAAEPTQDPLQAVEEYLWRHYEFSTRQPDFYWLMFVEPSGRRLARDPAGADWLRHAREHVEALVGRCIDAGLLPAGAQAARAFDLLFTAVHGAAVLRLGGRFCTRAEADALARDALRGAMSALGSGVPPRWDPQHAPAGDAPDAAGDTAARRRPRPSP